MRILGVIRLSVESDVTTSPERQRDAIEKWVADNGHEIIGWATDLDVSGAVSPWERPELGVWLNDRIDEFEGMCAWKLDRYARSVPHFAELLRWTEEHGKLVATSDNFLDTSTPMGRMMAYLTSVFAAWEREMISQRVTSMRESMRRKGRWVNGRAPFGFRKIAGEPTKLEIDPSKAKIVREIVDRRINGWTYQQICDWLNGRGITTAINKPWLQRNLRPFLLSPWLLGQTTHNGRVVIGDDGLPIQFADPIITEDQYAQLQQTKRKGWGNPVKEVGGVAKRVVKPYLLKGFMICGGCGEAMYRSYSGGKKYERYACKGKQSGCTSPASLSLKELDNAIEELFVDDLHDQEIYEKKFVPASNNTAQLARVERAIAEHRADRAEGLWEDDDDEYKKVLTRLLEQRKKLQVLPQHPAGYTRIPTGTTYGEKWRTADIQQRRELLAAASVQIMVCKGADVHPPNDFEPNTHVELKVGKCRVYPSWNVAEFTTAA